MIENYIKLPELTPSHIHELLNDSPNCSKRLKKWFKEQVSGGDNSRLTCFIKGITSCENPIKSKIKQDEDLLISNYRKHEVKLYSKDIY